MMVLLRAFALVVVAVGAGALHHYLGPTIKWDIEAPEPLPDTTPAPVGGDDATPTPPEGDETAQPGDDATTPTEDDGTPPAEPEAPALTYNDLGAHVGLAGARLIYQMANNGEAAIVDARRVEEYTEGHIPGAWSVRPTQFVPGGVPPLVVTDYMLPEQPVLIYCQGGDCDDSKNVGIKLRELGFIRVHIFDDGYPAWVDAGYDVERGPPQ